jgi:LysM repeat protein
VTVPTTAAAATPEATAPPGPDNPQASVEQWAHPSPTVAPPTVQRAAPAQPPVVQPKAASPAAPNTARKPKASRPAVAHVRVTTRRGVRHVTIGGRTWPVRKGQTLTFISSQTHATVVEIARANGIIDVDVIYAGETLSIPA